MGQGKSPLYTHRLMHRKRVTSELHVSYFRLMKIKHAIPKIEWAIEWAIEQLYNSVRTGSQRVGGQTIWRSDELEKRCGRKSHHSADGVWRSDQLVIRCSRESQQRVQHIDLISQASGWASGEQERHRAMSGGADEVNMLHSLFGLQTPLTCKPYNKMGGIFF